MMNIKNVIMIDPWVEETRAMEVLGTLSDEHELSDTVLAYFTGEHAYNMAFNHIKEKNDYGEPVVVGVLGGINYGQFFPVDQMGKDILSEQIYFFSYVNDHNKLWDPSVLHTVTGFNERDNFTVRVQSLIDFYTNSKPLLRLISREVAQQAATGGK